MDIAGIPLNLYLIALVVSIIIGALTNKHKVLGNFLVNSGGLVVFFLWQRAILTLQQETNPWFGWMVHPLTTTIVVGYGIGTFGLRFVNLAMKVFGG